MTRRHTDWLTLAAVALASSTSACASAVKLMRNADDIRPRMIAAALAMPSDTAKPRWRQPADDHDVLAIVPLSGDRLLVSGKGQRLYRASTGEKLWTQDSIGGALRLIAAEPLVFAADEIVNRSIVAADPATGTILWRRKIEKPHQLAIDDAGRRMVILERPDSQHVRLTVSDLQSEQEVWKREYAVRATPLLVVRGDSAFLLGKGTVHLALSDGTIRWRSDSLEAAELMPVGSRALVTSPAGVVTLLASDGRPAWRDSLSPTLTNLAADQQHVFLGRPDSATFTVTARRLTDGALAWRRDIRGTPTSPFLRADSLLLFTVAVGDTATIQGWSSASGRTLLSVPLPAQSRRVLPDSAVIDEVKKIRIIAYRLPCAEFAGTAVNVLPDQLTLVDRHLLVMQETRVSAFSIDGSRLLWTYPIPSPEVTSACVRYNQLAAVHTATELGKSAAVGRMSAALNVAAQAQLAQNRALSQQSHERRVQYYSQSSSGRALLPAVYGARAAELRMQQQFAQTQSIVALQASMMQVGAEIAFSMYFVPRIERVERMSELAQRSHFDATQGDWFIRAFARGTRVGRGASSWVPCRSVKHGIWGKSCDGFEGRTGVLIVNVRTGQWAELTTGPYESGIDLLTLNSQLPVLVPNSRLLFVSALGRDTTGWAMGNRLGYRLTTVPQSILAYDVGALRFNPPAAYATREVAVRGPSIDVQGVLREIKDDTTTLSDVARMIGVPATYVAPATVHFDRLVERNGHVALERVECTVRRGEVVRGCAKVEPLP